MKQTDSTEQAHSSMSAQEEQRWIRLAQSGDRDAFERLVVEYRDCVFGLAFRLMGDYDDANDLAQDVFLACYRKIGAFRGESRLKTWLYRIAVNQAKNTWKKRERRGGSVTSSIDDDPDEENSLARQLASEAPEPDRQAADREAASALWRCLDRINPERRSALVLRCMEGLSYEEIAEAQECSLGTIKSRINRARAELRELMKDYL
ncbi:MAG: ECF RNA polymerase sigma-E factor [candidate division BRC1 bacterium ADurb.BinA364]|nr:MAG: ECF RNA polymerase sigma-E factor [candidate division BRC1 bacterium ADurb.BinA364]